MLLKQTYSPWVKTPLWAAAAKAEHWANPWHRRRREHGRTSNNAGHWLSSRIPPCSSPVSTEPPFTWGSPSGKPDARAALLGLFLSLQPSSLSAPSARLETGLFISVTEKTLPKHVLKRTLKAALPSKWFVLGYLAGLFLSALEHF